MFSQFSTSRTSFPCRPPFWSCLRTLIDAAQKRKKDKKSPPLHFLPTVFRTISHHKLTSSGTTGYSMLSHPWVCTLEVVLSNLVAKLLLVFCRVTERPSCELVYARTSSLSSPTISGHLEIVSTNFAAAT